MMRPTDLARTSIGAIRAHPLRSALTALGVVIGVASVVAMTSIGLGAQYSVASTIRALGSNLLIVSSGSFRAGGASQGAGTRPTITDGDAEALARGLPQAAVVASAVRTTVQLVANGANWSSRIEGVTEGYLQARDWTMASGRFFDAREVRQGRKVAVIGDTVRRELFGEMDPIGQRLRIGSTPFEIVGVLAAKGQSSFGQDQDDIVLGPLDAVRSRLKGRSARVGSVDQIYVKGAREEDMAELEEQARSIIRERHRRSIDQDDDFTVQNMASILQASQSMTQTFTILLGAVAAVSLVVGGVGIMNIMLVAVTERTREIGLRMALGARRGDILRQFALESTVLSTAGGVVGLMIGAGLAFGIAAIAGWPPTLSAWATPAALGFSALIGIGFGAYPAWRAAQLDPIEALRRD